MANSFHHVHIKSRNPRQSARWWHDMFGATLLPEMAFGEMLFTPVEFDGVRFNITDAGAGSAGTASPPTIPYYGLEHVGIQVDDLDMILARFEEQGLHIYERRPGAGDYEIAFVATPDDVCLELLYLAGDAGS